MITTQDILNNPVRALSWKEPFASLMLHGKIETRLWDTKYRGLVLICASKAPYTDNQIKQIAGSKQFRRIFKRLKHLKAMYLSGRTVAIARLVDSRPMTPADSNACFVEYKEPWEEVRVSKKTGKTRVVKCQLWCHIYEDVQPITNVAFKGSQGWITLHDYDRRKTTEQLIS